MSDTPSASARPKIFIATPSHDHKFHASFAFSLFRLQAAHLFPLYITKVGGAGVARARNNQAHEFLTKTDCQYFFCIDSDIEFTPEQFARLVNHGLANVNGLYALKQQDLQWCINSMPGEIMDPGTGLQRVITAGTGFKCISRATFERQVEAHPEIAYVEDLNGERGLIRWDFFSMGVIGPNSASSRLQDVERLCAAAPAGSERLVAAIREIMTRRHPPGRYLTEDWYFDYRCGALDIPVHVDCTFHVKHEGLMSFPLQSPFDTARRWPAEFIAAGIAPDHCADVLDGAYDVAVNLTAPVILDIGANIGAFATWASARWPGCILWCYEPDPKNFALLQKTAAAIADESTSQIQCFQCAVLDHDAVMPLRRGAHNCGEHSLFDVGEQTAEAVDVEVIAGSKLPEADIMKLDTEGAEWPILVHLASCGSLKPVSAVLLEYHSEEDKVRITELLQAEGFILVGAKPRCPGRGELKFLKGKV